jgi:hypothetical protein
MSAKIIRKSFSRENQAVFNFFPLREGQTDRIPGGEPAGLHAHATLSPAPNADSTFVIFQKQLV